MTELLQRAVERALALPPDMQDEAARMILSFAGYGGEVVRVPRLPHLIFYQITGDEIVILAVRHGARAPASMPGRA